MKKITACEQIQVLNPDDMNYLMSIIREWILSNRTFTVEPQGDTPMVHLIEYGEG